MSGASTLTLRSIISSVKWLLNQAGINNWPFKFDEPEKNFGLMRDLIQENFFLHVLTNWLFDKVHPANRFLDQVIKLLEL